MSNLKQHIMKSVSLITLTLSVILFTISVNQNSKFLLMVGVFGFLLSLATFISAFCFQNKTKKTY